MEVTTREEMNLESRRRGRSENTAHCLAALLLSILVLSVYWEVGGSAFIHFDDVDYVWKNPRIQNGLTGENLLWAFTTTHAANWHPLTWLSHMLDVEWFGLDAGWHHRMNVFFHLLNSALVFKVFASMTGATWCSVFAASLFAVHPLHVESVAWVAERKDVLSTFFWFLTISTYIGYVRKPGGVRYILLLACFLLGLLAKPMVVTLPFVLLLLDWWPLGRLTVSSGSGKARRFSFPGVFLRVREKGVLFLFTAASCVITYAAQVTGGAVGSFQSYPFPMRAANALMAYVSYLLKAAWPASLAAFYPYPSGGYPVWKVAGAILFLSAISMAILRMSGKRPWLGIGWLWYLGTLVPVIGLVQVGNQSLADRYTYVPLVGIFVMLAWEGGRILEGWRYRRQVIGVVATGMVLVLAVVSRIQTGYWKDSTTLFTRALEVTENNYFAWNNLGQAYLDLGRQDKALEAYRESIRIKPDYFPAMNNIGVVYSQVGLNEKALNAYQEALRINPGYAFAWNNLGRAYGSLGRNSMAIDAYRQALARNPMYAPAWANLGNAYAGLNQHEQAISAYREALRIKPDDAGVLYNMGRCYAMSGQREQSRATYERLAQIDPVRARAFLAEFGTLK